MNLMKWVSRNVPEPVLFFVRPIYDIYIRAIRVILSVLDSLKIVGPDFIYSDDYYSKRQDGTMRSDAHQVGSVIKQYFEPDSVIDFGCAIGAHLEPFYKDGINIKGVEGNPDAFNYAVVPTKHLEQYDLRNKYNAEKEYDLVLSFELAEHLPERYADNFVDTLADAGDTIVMTAATPGQGGTHHVNEQPREYWYEKFESRGFEYDSEAVQELCSMIDVKESTWIPDNIMVFTASDSTK